MVEVETLCPFAFYRLPFAFYVSVFLTTPFVTDFFVHYCFVCSMLYAFSVIGQLEYTDPFSRSLSHINSVAIINGNFVGDDQIPRLVASLAKLA